MYMCIVLKRLHFLWLEFYEQTAIWLAKLMYTVSHLSALVISGGCPDGGDMLSFSDVSNKDLKNCL